MVPSFALFERYLFFERKLDRSNLSSYQGRYKKIEEFFLHCEFTRDNINLFLEDLQKKGYKNSSCNNYIKLLHHLCRYLKLDILKDYTYFKEDPTYIETLTPEEITKIIACLKGRFAVACEVLARTGMRREELMGLEWRDFQTDRLVLRNTKNNTVRLVPLLPDLSEKIKSLPHHKHPYIFGSRLGKMSGYTLNRFMREAAATLGITKRVTSHILRHSFITTSLSHNAPLAKVSRLVGHKNISSTMHYTHLVIEDLADVERQHPLSVPHIDFGVIVTHVKELVGQFKKAPVTIQIVENNQKLVVTIRKST